MPKRPFDEQSEWYSSGDGAADEVPMRLPPRVRFNSQRRYGVVSDSEDEGAGYRTSDEEDMGDMDDDPEWDAQEADYYRAYARHERGEDDDPEEEDDGREPGEQEDDRAHGEGETFSDPIDYAYVPATGHPLPPPRSVFSWGPPETKAPTRSSFQFLNPSQGLAQVSPFAPPASTPQGRVRSCVAGAEPEPGQAIDANGGMEPAFWEHQQRNDEQFAAHFLKDEQVRDILVPQGSVLGKADRLRSNVDFQQVIMLLLERMLRWRFGTHMLWHFIYQTPATFNMFVRLNGTCSSAEGKLFERGYKHARKRLVQSFVDLFAKCNVYVTFVDSSVPSAGCDTMMNIGLVNLVGLVEHEADRVRKEIDFKTGVQLGFDLPTLERPTLRVYEFHRKWDLERVTCLSGVQVTESDESRVGPLTATDKASKDKRDKARREGHENKLWLGAITVKMLSLMRRFPVVQEYLKRPDAEPLVSVYHGPSPRYRWAKVSADVKTATEASFEQITLLNTLRLQFEQGMRQTGQPAIVETALSLGQRVWHIFAHKPDVDRLQKLAKFVGKNATQPQPPALPECREGLFSAGQLQVFAQHTVAFQRALASHVETVRALGKPTTPTMDVYAFYFAQRPSGETADVHVQELRLCRRPRRLVNLNPIGPACQLLALCGLDPAFLSLPARATGDYLDRHAEIGKLCKRLFNDCDGVLFGNGIGFSLFQAEKSSCFELVL